MFDFLCIKATLGKLKESLTQVAKINNNPSFDRYYSSVINYILRKDVSDPLGN